MESEQRTLSLVNDVANTLESVAINTSHTPALYSTFLRAVIAARTAGPSAPPSPRIDANGNNQGAPSAGLQGNSSGHGNVSNSTLDIALASNPAAGVFGEEQQFGDGALGLKMFPPAAGGMSLSGDGVVGGTGTPAGATPGGNISWTPAMSGNGAGNELDLQAMSFQLPTTTGTDDFSSMSMDNILSGGFWDNVLIPGERLLQFQIYLLIASSLVLTTSLLTRRLLERRSGGPQWGFCLWKQWQWIYYASTQLSRT
jgi:hypothetical protein